MLRVRENRPERDRAGAFIYGNVGKLQRAFNRVDLTILHYQLNRATGAVFMQVTLFDGLLESHKVVA